jgi:uroporphyrinogen-III synthase
MSRPRVLVTRPADEAERLIVALDGIGCDTLLAPMLEVSLVTPSPAVPTAGVQAFLVTSANGARALAAALGPVPRGRGIPVFAVGEASAAATRDLGFVSVEAAGGDVAALAALVAERCVPRLGRLVHAAGSVVARDLRGVLEAKGFTVERIVLYEAVPARALSPEIAATVGGGRLDAILFFSPRTAETFVTLAIQAGCAGAVVGLAAVCLSAAVAQAAQALPWRRIVVAARPDQTALVESLAGVLADKT